MPAGGGNAYGRGGGDGLAGSAPVLAFQALK
jgi:hypothetical protein